MRNLTAITIVTLFALCSCGPKQEQQQQADTPAPEPAPVDATSSGEQRLTLNEAMIKDINAKLFLALHQDLMSYEPLVLVVTEEFNTDGTKFEYKLIRDNMDMGGWHDQSEYQQSSEESEESDEEVTADDAGVADQSGPEYAQASTKFYNNQVDTIIVKGSYEAYSSATGYLTLKTTGNRVYVNYATVDGDDVTIAPYSMGIGTITLWTDDPGFNRSNLYLKARIMLLADADLRGMDKDELGYFRNEIFARHGHTFKTPKMINYFAKQDWYKTNTDDAGPLLNKFEKQNVEFIKSKEGK